MAIAVEKFGSSRASGSTSSRSGATPASRSTSSTRASLVRDWRVPVARRLRSVVLGFDNFDRLSGALAAFRLARRPRRQPHQRRDASSSTARPTSSPANERRPHAAWRAGGPRPAWCGTARPDSANNAVRFTHTRPTARWAFRATSSSPRPIRSAATGCGSTSRAQGRPADADQRGAAPVFQPRHRRRTCSTTRYQIDGQRLHRDSASELIPTGAILPVDGTSMGLPAGPHDARRGAASRSTTTSTSCSTPAASSTDPVAVVTGPGRGADAEALDRPAGAAGLQSVSTDVPVPGSSGKHYGNHSRLLPRGPGLPRRGAPPAFPLDHLRAGPRLQPLVDIEIA